ncbi:hypothetical protein [Acidovorax sp. Leaf78]|uniref:hypothetical protein n=1 Tax=Acidovorax sp. Leaf78 TaxID=1736237 RepID=UPI000B308499|nr:hypothetical protein [Acidovorax sp. Leaf78]
MDRHPQLTLATLASGVNAVSPVCLQFELGEVFDFGKDLTQSGSQTDAEVSNYCGRMAAESNRLYRLALACRLCGSRLSKLTAGLGTTAKKGVSKGSIQAAQCISTLRKAVSCAKQLKMQQA